MEIETCLITPDEVVGILESEQTLILATCAKNRVTIRPVSHINHGLSVYYQTSADSLKMCQIRENPNVALCVGTYEIEGTAFELGHPLAEENAFFAHAYKQKHPGAYETYSDENDEIVVKVSVRHVRQWRYIDGKPFLAEMKEDAL